MRNLHSIIENQAMIRELFEIGAVLAALTLGSIAIATAGDFTGQASIIDGDTLEIHGTRIRLWGVDAESSQLCRGEGSLQYRCGAKAANDLDAFIAKRPVSCLPISLDRYGRTVATCSVGGTDLGDWLVSSGLALDWPQYSKASTTHLNAMPSKPGGGCGPAATSSRGYFEYAFGRAEARPIARMTPTLILDSCCDPDGFLLHRSRASLRWPNAFPSVTDRTRARLSV